MLISLCPLFLSLSMIRKCHELLPFRFFAIADVRTHSLLLGWEGRRPSPANFAGFGLPYTSPLPPPSPRKPSAGRERIYSAPGESNALGSRRSRHSSHPQPCSGGGPLRSNPCSTHERSVANFSASESVSPVCVVGRFPPSPTLCASTDSPTNPFNLKFPSFIAETKISEFRLYSGLALDTERFLWFHKLASQRPEFRHPYTEFHALRAIQAETTHYFSGDPPFLFFSPSTGAKQNGQRRKCEERADVSCA